jgi:hypothetical protein
MRNLPGSTTDTPSVDRFSGRPGGYKLVRGFGRGQIVRRGSRSGEKAFLAGVALIAVGIGISLLGLLTDIQLAGGQPIALVLAGGQSLMVGTILVCHHRLVVRTEANQAAFRTGYDLGLEDGDENCRKTHRPVVTDISAARRCTCGQNKVLSAALKVSDRV